MALICTLDVEMAARKLTTANLAKQIGINESTISKLRRNQFSMIDVKNFEKICRALDLQPGQLLHIETDT
jgi:putative transcriptional regulator